VGFRAIGSAVAQIYGHVAASLAGNIIAFVLCVPLLVLIGAAAHGLRSFSLIPLSVTLLIGVLPNPCTGGIHLVCNEIIHGDIIEPRDQWSGLKTYGRMTIVPWLLSVLVSAGILANMAFYARTFGSHGSRIQGIALPLFGFWLVLLLLWISIHLYVFPLFLEQEVKKATLVYRNAFLMVVGRPRTTVTVVPIWLFLLLICSATGLATVVGLALSAAIQHNVTSRLLPTFRSEAAR